MSRVLTNPKQRGSDQCLRWPKHNCAALGRVNELTTRSKHTMSNFLSQRWLLSRRHFLRGVGTTMALPLLDAMTPLSAAAAEAPAKPRRSVFVYIPNGVNGMTWQVTKPGARFRAVAVAQAAGKTSRRFHRLQRAVSSQRPGPGPRLRRHLADRREDRRPKRPAISQHDLVRSVDGRGDLASTRGSLRSSCRSLRGPGQPNNSCTLAFSRDGVPLPAEDNPRTVFDRLFGEEPGGVAAQRTSLHKRRSVLDAVLDDANSLRRDLGTDDRTKLDEYLHSRPRRRAADRAARRLARHAEAEGRRRRRSSATSPRIRPANTTARCST